MAPKRKQPAPEASAAPEAPSTVTTPRGKTFDTTAAASRPKRAIMSSMPPPDPPSVKKVKHSRTSTPSASESTPKPRGRPPKSSPGAATPKASPKMFRPGERQSARLASTPVGDHILPSPRRSRGTASATKSRVTKSAATTTKSKGRVPKKPKQPTRPDDREVAQDANDDIDIDIDYDDPTHDANITEATTIIQADRSYWLMKAEPDSRIEKTANGQDVDVKFTIDDLRARTEPEPWEGIRNAQAQNNLKAMRAGDLAFFYESNCKKPGLVGIMEIVNEASPDTNAFDKNSVYYDPKSNPDKPKWMLVHVEFRRKFGQKFTLKDLQKFSQPGGALAGMELFKQSRLSVTKVSKGQWDFIMSQVDDDDDDDDEMQETGVSIGAQRSDEDTPTDQDADTERIGEDLGNDFAAAFEAPTNLGTEPAASELPDVLGQLTAYAKSARSVSRGRSSRRPTSVPAGGSRILHTAALPAKHVTDAPSA